MRRSWRPAVACALASPLLLLAAAAALPDAAFTLALSVNALSVLVTGAAMWVAACNGDPRLRRSRRWFTAALAAAAAGFVVQAVHAELVGHVAVVSPATLAPLFWVPCALIGLLSVPSDRHREGGRLRAVLDGIVVTTALAIVFWLLFLAPIYGSSDQPALDKAVLLAYPAIDFVLATAAFAVASQARGDLRRFLRLVAGGLLLVAVADAGSAASVAAGATGFSWTFIVQQGGLAVLLCATLLPAVPDLATERSRAAALVDSTLPHLPVLLVVLVGLWRTFTGHQLDTVVVVLGSVMVLGLAGRQVLYASHLGAVAQRLSLEATRDPLTGLASRRSFLNALETSLAETAPGGVAVVLLDLDGFKEVNDTFGHAAGDQALVAFAARLTERSSACSLAARLGGDEFALFVVGPDAEVRAMASATSLAGGRNLVAGAVRIQIGASAGVATSRPGDSTSSLLRRADLAMYDAKRSGVSQAAVFADEMAVRAERRHLLTQALPEAAARGELRLVYQPIFRLDDGSVAGAEALLRWHSPVHGDVSPDEFVPLAEETGVIGDLGLWVLSRAAAQLQEWAAAGRHLPALSVNVSPRQLTATFAREAVRRMAERGVTPSQVTLEITESAMPDLPGNRCIEQLRGAGFVIAMDDFGAGFSSLAQLAALPVDTLKFDREFIRGISTPNGRRIVEAVIALAGDLGLTTVAEGIETAAEAEVVLQAGCALAQGYHFSRPLSPERLVELLARPPVLPSPRAAQVPTAR